MRKKTKHWPTFSGKTDTILNDLHDTEKEFGILLSSHWEFLMNNPVLQKKMIHGAKRLQEVRLILASQKKIRRSVQ